ncbi:hypothetical protein ST201phi2-1p402 [Pseudomonas phage 201phi2-1]|uniref:Uncharacterized protein n=1 Tax=Pseudomonas phage 201phi2-1 TaxID=198110 RepID=B3FJR1_BP201|nr:hypothetical protein ST201phi2-1p402 [Pseudomonas phage 201phi2-1]ABY63226.1 hypothetical protein 201phi2-1p402 [Pseudomonas phage 201phi2-1]
MKRARLKEAIVNVVLDIPITLAPAGAEVTILEDNGSNYEVAYYGGESPSTTFYVRPNQVELINE